MAPQRRSIYQEDSCSSSDDSDSRSDATFEPSPKRRKQSNMADEIPHEPARKRGRGMSKRPCLNRNAQMARENRQKKKEYLMKIENKLSQLQKENKNLNNVIHQQNIDIKKLNADVLYLRSVLNNKSSITMLLKSMNQNLQRFRPRAEREPSNVYQIGAFSKFDPLERKPFSEDLKFKKEDPHLSSTGIYQDGPAALGINNNVTIKDEGLTFDKSEQEGDFDHLLPVTPVSMNGKADMTLEEGDLTDFPNLNSVNIFDDLTQLDDVSNTLDFGADSLLDNNFFESLNDNSGICLHVNPSRVSLEFCSSCQMNSANSAFE